MGWWIGLGVLILLAGLLGAACVRAALLKNPEKRGEPQPVDGEKAAKYAKDLSRMIRCETISVRESGPAEKFARYRAELEQLFPLVHERLERTLIGDAMLFKWRGTDPARGAVVLMAHSDVVPAAGEWDHPPFAGEIADGCVWGPGSYGHQGVAVRIVQRGGGAAGRGIHAALRRVSRQLQQRGDHGGRGAQHRHVADGSRGEARFGAGRGRRGHRGPHAPGLDGKYAMLGVLEKGYADVRFTAVSAGGHSSTPPKGTPLARLAAFVNRVETRPPFPIKITPPVKAMFAAMAPDMAFPFRLLFGNLWLFGPLLKRVIPKVSGQAGALLHTTCAFTMAQGSDAPNVIPAQASVTANLRFMVHQGREASLQALEKLANKYGLRMEVLYACDCSPVVDVHSAGYAYIRQCVREVFPEAGIVPYVMLGGTDAKHYAKVCDCALRFAPTVLTPQQLASMHARNENLSVDALARAVAFYRRVLTGYR